MDDNDLGAIVDSAPVFSSFSTGVSGVATKPDPVPTGIRAVPFAWNDPAEIPTRKWVYDRHYIRQYVSVTGGIGGAGKSTILIAEALAIVSGKDLLGTKPMEACPVWYVNLEDPADEVNRRFMAAIKHFNLRSSDFEGRLFISSGRDARFTLARESAEGIAFIQPNIEAIRDEIIRNKIGVVIMEPFVKLHNTPENSNDSIDAVITEIARLADDTNCAFELAHHLKKGNGSEPTADDLRGASSLIGAVRSARLVVPMTESEHSKLDLECHRRQYIKVIDAKGNMAPPADQSVWRFLESIDLGNETDTRPSDFVGVATAWKYPGAFDDVTIDHVNKIRTNCASREWRESPQAKKWVGKMVADVIGLDLDNPADKYKVKRQVKTWINNGVLKVEELFDDSRQKRKFVMPGNTISGAKL